MDVSGRGCLWVCVKRVQTLGSLAGVPQPPLPQVNQPLEEHMGKSMLGNLGYGSASC